MNDGIALLAIAAHPDDVEMSAGGVVAAMVRSGHRVVVADCTRGEMGTRGSAELRDQEAELAARILGVEKRENLEMPDGHVDQSDENVLKLVRLIRHYRPHILLFPPSFERHPDHEAVHRLCRTAYFKSGLTKVETEWEGQAQRTFRPAHMFCYIQAYHHEADFFVDVSSTHEQKIESIRAFGSQVHVPGAPSNTSTGNLATSALPEPQTFISKPEFMEMLESRARYFGSLIGVRYAEGFLSVDVVGLSGLEVFLP